MNGMKSPFSVISNPDPKPAVRNIAEEQQVMFDFIEKFPRTWSTIAAFIGFDGKDTLVNLHVNHRVSSLTLAFQPRIDETCHAFGPAHMNALIQIRDKQSLKIVTRITDREFGKLIYSMDLSDLDWRKVQWDEKDAVELNTDEAASAHLDNIFRDNLPDTYAVKRESARCAGMLGPCNGPEIR